MKPVRILFPFAGDTVIGGSHVSALSLAAALDRNRFEPLVLMHFAAGEVGAYAQSLGLSFTVLRDVPLLGASGARDNGAARPAGYLLRTLPALVRHVRAADAAIVHTNDGRMHVNWAPATRLAGRRHLWHHRGDPSAFGVNKLAPLLADRIVSVSHFSRPTRPVLPIGRRFSVVRSPFDFDPAPPDRAASRAALLTELGLPPNAVLIGYFGILNARKRPQHFVRAVARIGAAMPGRPVHGLVFGANEVASERLDEDCRRLAADLGIPDRIHLMGFRRPVDGCIAGVDMTLVTALNEPFGRTLIEAMYLGTPVVATRHGGNIEAIREGETGFLVDPDDPGAFIAPALRLLAEDGLSAAISRAARQEAVQNYGTAIHVRQIGRIYDELLGQIPVEAPAHASA